MHWIRALYIDEQSFDFRNNWQSYDYKSDNFYSNKNVYISNVIASSFN